FQTFERVVVQNILHGLSPSLSDAIASVSRWKLVRAALPHVIQCCGSLLEASDGKGLSSSLQKILYILHWMLLDSAAECAELSPKDDTCQYRGQGLFSLSSIQLFVYLITPLAEMVSEEDIAGNIRLESGLKIWQALWQYRQPDVWCFTAPVKQRRDQLPQVTFLRRPTAASIPPNQSIYVGEEEKPRRPSVTVIPPPKPPRTDRAVLDEKRRREMERRKREESEKQKQGQQTELTPFLHEKSDALLVEVQDGCPSQSTPTMSSIVRSVSEYKTGETVSACNKISKSKTANAFDMSPTSECSMSMLEEVDTVLNFTEENNSLSGVFCPSDAPLVNISDICSGFSTEAADSIDSSALCENCRKISPRDRPTLCDCQFRVNGSIPLPANDTPPVILTRASTTDDTVSSSSQHTVIPVRPPPKSPKSEAGFHGAETARVQPAPAPKSTDVGSTDDEIEDFGQPDPM
ncbi:hypothetical protein NECAME_10987, partial [Necator americanus]